LTLDKELLAELLGTEELRELLDPRAIETLELELQGLLKERWPRDVDEAADLLRRLGDLTTDEAAARGIRGEWLDQLERERRAAPPAVATSSLESSVLVRPGGSIATLTCSGRCGGNRWRLCDERSSRCPSRSSAGSCRRGTRLAARRADSIGSPRSSSSCRVAPSPHRCWNAMCAPCACP